MKVKKDTTEVEEEEIQEAEGEKLTYKEKLELCTVIAKPMASKKLTKKLYKIISKASKQKKHMASGLKEVQTRIRKGERGIVILAGDVTPIDIMCHLPAVCEENEMPYAYVPSRQDLGAAMGVRRACMCVMIKEHEEFKELYDDCFKELDELPLPI